jgi:uncharacterized protein with HEPN domain
MWPDERDAAYLLDMLQAAEKVRRFVKDVKQDEFVADEVLRDAIERNIEIIGEAARKVSDAFKKQSSWNSLAQDGSPAERTRS